MRKKIVSIAAAGALALGVVASAPAMAAPAKAAPFVLSSWAGFDLLPD